MQGAVSVGNSGRSLRNAPPPGGPRVRFESGLQGKYWSLGAGCHALPLSSAWLTSPGIAVETGGDFQHVATLLALVSAT